MSIYRFVVQQQLLLWRSLPRVKTELEQFHNCSFLEIDSDRSQVNVKVRAMDSDDAAHWSWVKGGWRDFIWITCISFKGETSAQSCVVSTSVEQCVKKVSVFQLTAMWSCSALQCVEVGFKLLRNLAPVGDRRELPMHSSLNLVGTTSSSPSSSLLSSTSSSCDFPVNLNLLKLICLLPDLVLAWAEQASKQSKAKRGGECTAGEDRADSEAAPAAVQRHCCTN